MYIFIYLRVGLYGGNQTIYLLVATLPGDRYRINPAHGDDGLDDGQFYHQ